MEIDQLGRLRDILEASRLIAPYVKEMRGMRNIVAHDYANVELSIVWQVATIHVPDICATLEKFLSKEPPPPAPPA